MTPNRFLTAPALLARSRLAPSIQPRRLAPALGLVLLASMASSFSLGCGGESDRMGSTDTGNPPVIVSQKLHITPAPSGVTVSGDAGAVTAGARVDVVNTSTGDSEGTTAGDDGSFAVEIAGGVNDEYRVYAELAGQTTRADVNASGGSTGVGLAGLDFLLQSVEGYTLVENTSIALSFDTRDVNASAGCNSLAGQYSLCQGRLCVNELSTTDIGCDAARHAQDEWLGNFLTASPLVSQTGPSLTLTGATATLQFLDSEVADPDRPLAGPTWVIDTLIDGGSASSVPVEPVPTVVFRSDGTLRVQDSCHTGEGTYTVSAGSLELVEVLYTEEGCNIEANQVVAQHIQDVLQEGTISFEIDQNRLTIERGALGLGALASE